ncbi:hypothetical protein F5Y10DRAFT_269535 [Nemania abortiva]|nr:hypothetical protein F5Y10DRAFT_269535 [Nemania abortiva]
MATPTISGMPRTNLGPLTTDTWTYTCTEVIQQCSTCHLGWAAQTCVSGTVTNNQGDCLPPRATNVPATTGGAVFVWGVYSPGIICPGGYTSAVGATYGGSSDFNFQYPLTAGETAIGCCPQGGFLPIRNGGGRQTCVQFKPSTSFLIGTCGADGPAYTPFSVGGTLNSMTYKHFIVSAPMYQAVFQASDLTASSTSSSITTQSISGSNSDSSGDTSFPQTNGASPGSGKDSVLQKGAIIGIAIGATGVAILVAAAVIFLWRRARKRRRVAAAVSKPVSQYHSSEHPELKPPVSTDSTGDPAGVNGVPHCLYDSMAQPNLVEVNPNYPAELPHLTPVAELGSLPYGVKQ